MSQKSIISPFPALSSARRRFAGGAAVGAAYESGPGTGVGAGSRTGAVSAAALLRRLAIGSTAGAGLTAARIPLSPHAFASTRHCRYMNVYTQVVSATAISKRMRMHGALVYIPMSDVRKSLSDVRRSLLNRFRHGILSSASIL
ncbi:hypothetical protein DPMN_160889 [Dreissena polymorpha]|uniref:Uncharacterized protein n=1 Tax=Dreissena polymorpha TaxID=45954 RepID=A0A9D4ELM9_DREPO|nr:hypothetical protein DPMN_160889 [Dreissena polymorpha]